MAPANRAGTGFGYVAMLHFEVHISDAMGSQK
jgi:hypothetical protein